MNNAREQWGSRIGFILAASGSAVGLGNIWKFPYTAGQNGGGAFTLIYLVCILSAVIPACARMTKGLDAGGCAEGEILSLVVKFFICQVYHCSND